MAKNLARPTGIRFPPQGLAGLRGLYQHPPDNTLRITVGAGLAKAVSWTKTNTQILATPLKMLDLAITGASAAISKLKSIPINVIPQPVELYEVASAPTSTINFTRTSTMPTKTLTFEIL